MKKITVLSLTLMMALLAANLLTAQIKTPQSSPVCKTSMTVGLTDVSIEYSRPSMKGRAIFAKDGLVPFGEMWRTGANKNTTITFGDAVKVSGKEVKAGTYSLFTIPGADEWTIIFYTDAENWGLPEKWDATKEAARFNVKSQKMGVTVESFLINIGDIRSNTANLELIWENTLIEIQLEADVDTKVMKEYDRLMAGPTQGDYYNLASYYHETKKDMFKALEFVNKATASNPKFWHVRRKSEILADLGRYEEAIEAAQQSLKLAQEANNMDYVRINEKNIGMWNKKVGKKN
jgi:hypothetical protein